MSITLLYGTGNEAKLRFMRRYLEQLDLNVIGLKDIQAELPEVNESGDDPLENARIKAVAYFKATGLPTFSCDSGLYIKDVPPDLQPGVHVRNINGKCLTDDEMLAYYSALAQKMGGQMTAQYRNGICLVLSETEIYEHMGDDIAYERFVLCAIPHEKRNPGFPLDSISKHIETGQYYYDMPKLLEDGGEGFRAFFSHCLKL